MRRLLKLAAALGTLAALSACVVVPLPRHHHGGYYGYSDAYPAYPGRDGYYAPRRHYR